MSKIVEVDLVGDYREMNLLMNLEIRLKDLKKLFLTNGKYNTKLSGF